MTQNEIPETLAALNMDAYRKVIIDLLRSAEPIPENPYDTAFEVLENPYDEVSVEKLMDSFGER